MATKKPQTPKGQVNDVQLVDGVDAEISYQAAAKVAASSSSEKQWLEETAQRWEKRDSQEKDELVKRDDGQAVIVVADATGAVGESLVVADASSSDNRKAAVEVKKDDSHDDKGGYLWGGLGLLGLVGIAAAAGGGGGGGGGSDPTPLTLSGLVIDDPVANAVVFRDIYNDGLLHVISVDGGYIIDPDQSVVVTNDSGEFSHLAGSGRIISAGINVLPIAIYDTLAHSASQDSSHADVTVAGEGSLLFANEANYLKWFDLDQDTAINDGHLAYIAADGEVFNTLIVSSGVTLTVGSEQVNLVSGVTALVDAYITQYNLDVDAYNLEHDDDIALNRLAAHTHLDIESTADVKTASIAVANLFGVDLDQHSSNSDVLSFLLGGYDVNGIDSPNNLNQEIFALINGVFDGLLSLGYDNFDLSDPAGDAQDYIEVYSALLTAILDKQALRTGTPEELVTFANNHELVHDMIANVIDATDPLISSSDADFLVDLVINHATSGSGVPDIYAALSGDQVNVLDPLTGDILNSNEVELAGNISIVAGEDYYGPGNDVSRDFGGYGSEDVQISLLGSNILVNASGEDSYASLDIQNAVNATGETDSNGQYRYDVNSDHVVALGNVTVFAGDEGDANWAESADAYLNLELDGQIAGDVTVKTNSAYSDAYGWVGSTSGSGASALQVVDLADLGNSIDDSTDTRVDLRVDGAVTLSAIIQAGTVVNSDTLPEVIADLIAQWTADPDYSAVDNGNLKLWSYDGDSIRLSWDAAGYHAQSAVDVYTDLNSEDPDTFTAYQNADGEDQSTLEFVSQGDHSPALLANAEGGYSQAHLDVEAATGALGDITASVVDSYDSSVDLHLDFSGDVFGDITSSVTGDSSDTYLSLDANVGSVVLHDTQLTVIADGYDSSADIYMESGDILGTVSGIEVSASGDYADAYISINADIEISNTISVNADGYCTDAYANIENTLGDDSAYVNSHVNLNDVTLSAVADGEGSGASIDLYNANATGSVVGISATSGQGVESSYDWAAVGLDINGTVSGSIQTDADNNSFAGVYLGSTAPSTSVSLDHAIIDANAGEESWSNVWVRDSVGTVSGISSEATGSFSSSDMYVNFDGLIEGDINVLANNVDGSYDVDGQDYWNYSLDFLSGDITGSLSAVFIDADSQATLDVDHLTLSANGNGAISLLEINADGEDFAGSIDITSVTATGWSSQAIADVSGDIDYGQSITVTANGQSSDASFTAYNVYDGNNIDVDSRITFNGTDLTVNSFGEDANASLDMTWANATGTVGDITVTADAVESTDRQLWGTSADAYLSLDLSGDINGDITINANHSFDYASLDIESLTSDSPYAERQSFYEATDRLYDLSANDIVTLTIGSVTLTARVGLDTYNDEPDVSEANVLQAMKNIVADFEADPRFASLNISLGVIGDGGDYDPAGINVAWLVPGDQPPAILNVDGEDFASDSYAQDGTDRETAVNLNDVTITMNALDDFAEAGANIDDAVGTISSITATATGYDSSTDLYVQFDGDIGSTITLNAQGENSDVDVYLDADTMLTYNNTSISAIATGQGSWAAYAQNGIARGTISSITASGNGNNADTDILIGGDLTIADRIDALAKNSSVGGNTSQTYVHLTNIEQDGQDSEIFMDGVTINVDAQGDAFVYLTADQHYHYDYEVSSDFEVPTLITGDINLLNISAGIASDDYEVVYGGAASVDLFLDAEIDQILVNTSNDAVASLDLYGRIETNNGNLTVSVNSAYGSDNYVYMSGLVDDVASVNLTATENSYTDLSLGVNGSIANVDITARKNGEIYASFDLTGANHVIDDLDLTSIGQDDTDYGYESSVDVTVDQEWHGGNVHVAAAIAERYSTTSLAYTGEYQADEIHVDDATDGSLDSFYLSMDMTDSDILNGQAQTKLENYQTTIYGFTDGSTDNNNENYFEFGSGDLYDGRFLYDVNNSHNYGISLYSDGLNGSQYGLDVLTYSANHYLQDDGYYGSYNQLLNAAKYGIASDYAIFKLSDDVVDYNWQHSSADHYEAVNYDLNISLDTGYSINLHWDHSWTTDTQNLGDLVDELVDNLKYTQSSTEHSWTNLHNIELFDNGGGQLGVRVNEGSIVSINLTAHNNVTNLNTGADAHIEGGGYFLGMMDLEADGTYNGFLAMDEDGNGVTKIVELADVHDYYDFSSNYVIEMFNNTISL